MKNPIRALALTFALAASASCAFAQSQAGYSRTLPDKAKLGTLEIVVFPQARLDGKNVTMAPGARITDTANMLATPGSLRGRLPVLYRVDLLGQVKEAWILTPEEVRKVKAAAAGQGSGSR